MRRSLLTAICALIGFLWLMPAAMAQSCRPGYGLCPDGGCAPLGSTCCPNGRYAESGRFCCSDGSSCPNGTVCTKPGDNYCLSRTSARVCSDGRSYCNEGYRCGSDNKCYPMSASPGSGGGGSDDRSSGVRDASHCIDVDHVRGSTYRISNTCTFGVNVKVSTMDFSPRTTTIDSYYIGANSDITAISYHAYQPVIVSACGRGSVC